MMQQDISCPNCTQPVDPNARYCSNCGVDLALAAALAEREVMAHTLVPRESTVSGPRNLGTPGG